MGKQARARSQELRKARAAIAAQRAGKRRRVALAGGLAIVVGLLVAIVAVIGNAVRDRDTGGDPGAVVAPAGATAAGALVAGRSGAPVRLAVYLDFMCPYCARFELANSTEIERLAGAGTVRLELHPLAFLDRLSAGTRYSTRAANATATVADRAPAHLLAFGRALFAAQPAEGSPGLTDEKIAELARQSGVAEAVVRAFADRTFEPWIARSTASTLDSGITRTPTVQINGEPYEGDLYTTGPLTRAVTAAAGG